MRSEVWRKLVSSGLAVTGLVLVLALASAPVHAAEGGEVVLSEPTFGISVKVLGSPQAESGGLGPGSSDFFDPTGARSANGDVSTTDAVDTAPPAPTPAASDFALAGGLYVSEMSGSSVPTLNPFEGTTVLAFTLRNISTDTIDGSVEFWLASPLGTEVGREKVAITSVKPMETRVVTARVHGAGQWPFVNAAMTFTPPSTIAGSEVAPVGRSIPVAVFPWLILVLLVTAVVGVIVWRVVTAAPARPFAEVAA